MAGRQGMSGPDAEQTPRRRGFPPVGSRPERPLVIAHRGASADRPENTLAAYELAVAQGADAIEIDLHRTGDGHVVVLHDPDLSGLGGRGEVADARLEAVRALDAGGGARVPTLGEVLDGFGSRIAFNLEIKRGRGGLYVGLETGLAAELEARGLLAHTLISSFYDPVLSAWKAASPGARAGLLISPRFPERAVERARAAGAEALHPERSLVDRRLVEEAHDAGLAVYVFTVDDSAEMQRMLELGVDGLFTNVPVRLRRLVDAQRQP